LSIRPMTLSDGLEVYRALLSERKRCRVGVSYGDDSQVQHDGTNP
jgi:hypothetical protein